MKEWCVCQPCLDYLNARQPVLVPALADRAEETDETGVEILDRYMTGVHTRHLSGLPILPGDAA